MDFFSTHLLSLILFLPAISAVIMLFLPSDARLQRWFAFSASLIPFILTLVLWNRFDANATGFQFQEKYTWYAAINASFHVGVDGISLAMVFLTTFLTPLAMERLLIMGTYALAQWGIALGASMQEHGRPVA